MALHLKIKNKIKASFHFQVFSLSHNGQLGVILSNFLHFLFSSLKTSGKNEANCSWVGFISLQVFSVMMIEAMVALCRLSGYWFHFQGGGGGGGGCLARYLQKAACFSASRDWGVQVPAGCTRPWVESVSSKSQTYSCNPGRTSVRSVGVKEKWSSSRRGATTFQWLKLETVGVGNPFAGISTDLYTDSDYLRNYKGNKGKMHWTVLVGF